MSEASLVKVDHLGIAFRRGKTINPAVYDSTFEVRRGETLAIVGESGSGKSVSSLSLMQLLHRENTVFTSGRFILNESLMQTPTDSMELAPTDDALAALRGKKIAMIFQEPMTSLNPVLTCGFQVEEVIVKHLSFSREKARQKTLDLFLEVKLPRAEQMLNQYPHELSGGQRQRVMIAMAIACEPQLLIADEPTTALDVTVQKEILQLLKQLQLDRGMGMIFITHDLGVVEEIADDVLVMKQGRVVEYGKAQRILTNPTHEYTRGLLQCRPDPTKKNSRLLTVRDFEHNLSPELKPKNTRPITDSVFLKTENLTKVYHTPSFFKKNITPVIGVDNVSFHMRKGETLGLVGESGCGKTTLSRMLLGLIPASHGSIEYTFEEQHSIDITKLRSRDLRLLRKEIQLVFQDPYSALNPKHTIGSALTEPMYVHNIGTSDNQRKALAAELLEKVGLSADFYNRYPHEFSGGQRQRIVIARALACKPSFIICDESVSALDVSVQAQVLNLLNDLKYEFGLTYLFISHDLRVVHYMSDRIMVMNKGRVEEIGDAEEVFNHPSSDYTKRLLNAIPGGHTS
jgi:peptide/nickel transport system ATP-binding protein